MHVAVVRPGHPRLPGTAGDLFSACGFVRSVHTLGIRSLCARVSRGPPHEPPVNWERDHGSLFVVAVWSQVRVHLKQSFRVDVLHIHLAQLIATSVSLSLVPHFLSSVELYMYVTMCAIQFCEQIKILLRVRRCIWIKKARNTPSQLWHVGLCFIETEAGISISD